LKRTDITRSCECKTSYGYERRYDEVEEFVCMIKIFLEGDVMLSIEFA